MMKISESVAELLGHYVYVYRDPRNGQPFYVGRGQRSRMFQHLEEMQDSEKVALIQQIRSSGNEPRIEVLRYGMTGDQAMLVEAAAIDLVGKNNLTNVQVGNHKTTFGKISSRELIAMSRRKPADFQHRALLVSLNRSYRSDMSDQELYEYTRGIWRLDVERARTVELAMPIYQGIIRAVYRPDYWCPAGTTDYQVRVFEPDASFKNRWEFVGSKAMDVWDQYIDCDVGKFGQNPVRYESP